MDLNILAQSPQQRRRSNKKTRPDDDSNIMEDDEGNLQRRDSMLSGSFYQKRGGGSGLRIKKEVSAGATTNAVAPGDQPNHDQFLDDMLMSSKQKQILGTEVMIEKMLQNLDVIDDENLDVWNIQDEEIEPESRKNISYIKMKNEIDQREARITDKNGKLTAIPVCGAGPGWHSSSRKIRSGKMDNFGPGINLYLKMLKYLACWFFIFTILSLPILVIYGSGSAFSDQNAVAALVGRSSLGNLGIS